MISSILSIQCGENEWTINASPDQTVLEILRAHKIYMPAPCGGRGTCGKCKCKTIKGSFTISAADERVFSDAELHEGWRLTCMCRVREDSEILIEAEHDFSILTSYEASQTQDNSMVDSGFALEPVSMDLQCSVTDFFETRFPGKAIHIDLLRKLAGLLQDKGNRQDNGFEKREVTVLTDSNRIVDVFTDSPLTPLGVAIDIGTTTICMTLVELLTGHKLGDHARINRQREYGADVISRIQCAGQGKLIELRDSVVRDILDGLREMSLLYHIETENIRNIVIAGNTTMLHLLLGIPCDSLGQFPFTPVMTNLGLYSFSDIFNDNLCSCPVTLLPSVSAYVGADITAGMIFCGGKNSNRPSLLVDLGTNGEMAIFSKDKILCTSTAAGPAFEGGNISCGIGSVPGAVSFARYEDRRLAIDTIGGQKPIGICGSGAIDIVAALVKAGIIEETGLMDDDYFETGFPVVPESNILFTQKDIRELQLAKSAVRAGIEVLLTVAGVSYEEIQYVYLAGGFGHKLNLDSAETIGLIPGPLRSKVSAVGNSSLGGCVQILTNRAAEREVVAIAREAGEINLSHNKHFNDLFMEYMYFSS